MRWPSDWRIPVYSGSVNRHTLFVARVGPQHFWLPIRQYDEGLAGGFVSLWRHTREWAICAPHLAGHRHGLRVGIYVCPEWNISCLMPRRMYHWLSRVVFISANACADFGSRADDLWKTGQI